MGELIVYRKYMQRKRAAEGVIIEYRDSSGIHLAKQTHLDASHSIIPGMCMVEFNEGGSGFIIKALRNPITIKNPQGKKYILGLLLTVSHILCNTTTFEPTKKSFRCKIDRLIDAEAIYLRNFMNECTETLISQTNGNSFVYPGDLTLCLVVSDRKKRLNDIPIAHHTEITERMPVFVAGFQKIQKNTSTATQSLVVNLLMK